MEWIAAEKELPDESERVLLFTPYQVLGDEHTFVGNLESITTCTARIKSKQVPVFTHWMPLPPDPEQHP
jgi:hypothetical protein